MNTVPHLVPLQQWICDVCGNVIQSREEGYFQLYADEEGSLVKFKIIHKRQECDLRSDAFGRFCGDLPLDSVLGEDGVARLLSYIDIGIHNPNRANTKVRSDRIYEWADFFRRLYIPNFEEGRFFIHDAISNGMIDSHEMRPYQQNSLTDYIKTFNVDEK